MRPLTRPCSAVSARTDMERWGRVDFIDVPRYRSPYFYPTASIEGSMSRLPMRGKDARLAMMGRTYFPEIDEDLDDDDDDLLDGFGEDDDLDEALGALPPRHRRAVLGAVQRAVYAAEQAEEAAATAKRSAIRTKKAIRPFAAVSRLFERKPGGGATPATKALIEAKRLLAPPPEPPAPIVVAPPPEKQRLGIGAMVGIGVAVLALGVGAGVVVARANR